MAELIQINISRGGVPKRAISEGVLTPLGIEGDGHAHPRFHGGPEKAVLLIAAETIDRLRTEGYPIFYGALGENFTTRGIDPALLRAGQRLRVGPTVIELTTLRVPCNALDVYGPGIKQELYDMAVKRGDFASPRWALGGFYASVVRTGTIRTNDSIVIESSLA